MPLYLYRCQTCGEKFEKFSMGISEQIDVCKLCGGGPALKIMAAPNFIVDNTSEGVIKKAQKDADRISAKVRQMDPTTLEDIYGIDKAENIYKGHERAVDVVPKMPVKYKEVKEKFKKMQAERAAVKQSKITRRSPT